MEFFVGVYDLLEDDLLKIIKDSRTSRGILATFNTTFIVLIPKPDNPLRFEEYMPISLCNCIYTIISKIIARRVKDLMSISTS
jgi:hypothetical protein